MPTIHDPAGSPRTPARPHRPGRSRAGSALTHWPIGLLLLLVLLAGWRVASSRDQAGAAATTAGTSTTEQRTFGAARLQVPREWITLERREGHVTWGSSDRRHTVTLASTEAGLLPLPAVVGELVEQSAQQLPGARLTERPRSIPLAAPHPRDDAAMLARFRVEDPSGGDALHVAQVWRRDARAGLDLVATWTSRDGRWPVSPRSAVPQVEGSR